MRNFIKHYVWFYKQSKGFMNYNTYDFIINGGLLKGFIHAIDMCNWNKMSELQKKNWYLNSDRNMEVN